MLDHATNIPPHGLAGQVANACEVQSLDQLRVNLSFQFLEVLIPTSAGPTNAWAGQARNTAGPTTIAVIEAVELRNTLLKSAHCSVPGASSACVWFVRHILLSGSYPLTSCRRIPSRPCCHEHRLRVRRVCRRAFGPTRKCSAGPGSWGRA